MRSSARRSGSKHENHGAVGAFKLRGGLVYFDGLRRREPEFARRDQRHARQPRAVRFAFAARRNGLAASIVVPRGKFAREERRDACARRRSSSNTAMTSRRRAEHAAQLGRRAFRCTMCRRTTTTWCAGGREATGSRFFGCDPRPTRCPRWCSFRSGSARASAPWCGRTRLRWREKTRNRRRRVHARDGLPAIVPGRAADRVARDHAARRRRCLPGAGPAGARQ